VSKAEFIRVCHGQKTEDEIQRFPRPKLRLFFNKSESFRRKIPAAHREPAGAVRSRTMGGQEKAKREDGRRSTQMLQRLPNGSEPILILLIVNRNKSGACAPCGPKPPPA